MRGTVLIVTDQIYCPATSHAVPARPFGKAKTKSTADGRSSGQSVSQSVLVSSSSWGSWPCVSRCTETCCLSSSGAFSDENAGLSFI